jgi:hypothetical protein
MGREIKESEPMLCAPCSEESDALPVTPCLEAKLATFAH